MAQSLSRRETWNDGDIRVSYLARTHGGGFSEQEAITGARSRTDISIRVPLARIHYNATGIYREDNRRAERVLLHRE